MGFFNRMFGGDTEAPVKKVPATNQASKPRREKKLQPYAARVLGWVHCLKLEMLVSIEQGTETWSAEPGFNMLMVLVRIAGNENPVVEFIAREEAIRLDTGEEVHPIGIAPCLHERWRPALGHKVPTVLATQSFALEQLAGNCVGHLYCIPEGRKLEAVQYGGDWIDGIIELETGEETVGPGEPDKWRALATPGRVLAGRPPSPGRLDWSMSFCDRDGAWEGFREVRLPNSLNGLRGIGSPTGCPSSWGDLGETSGKWIVVVLRVPQDQATLLEEVDSEDIWAELRDGSKIPARGIINRWKRDPGCPDIYGVLHNATVSRSGAAVRVGGVAIALDNYLGPFTHFSDSDCKLVIAFGPEVEFDVNLKIHVGGYCAALEHGADIYQKPVKLSKGYIVDITDPEAPGGKKRGIVARVSDELVVVALKEGGSLYILASTIDDSKIKVVRRPPPGRSDG